MRIASVRAWLNGAVSSGIGAARRVGHAMTRRIKDGDGSVSRGVGVGDDESSFGGGRSTLWIEIIEETRKKLLAWVEKSTFERFPGLERLLRRFLGGRRRAVPPPLARPKISGPLGAQVPAYSKNAAEYREQVRRAMMQVHTGERAGLAHAAEQRRHRS